MKVKTKPAVEQTPDEYTQYLDPKYAEQLMSESLNAGKNLTDTGDESLSDQSQPQEPPRKGPRAKPPSPQ